MNVMPKSAQRDSNMELLRIVAMILVMVVHANFRALPVPSVEECETEVTSSVLRFFTESLSIICVNLFILLSGWYGIKFKTGRVIEFLFQILFFSVLSCAIYYALNPSGGYVSSPISNILLLNSHNYWFVKAYLGLYIFAPVLNAFIENVSKEKFRLFLIAFFLFQTIYGWAYPSAALYFESGYSAISFMGLYMLGRYVRLYPAKAWQLDKRYDMAIYVVIVLLTTVMAFFVQRYSIPILWRFYIYTSPLVIVSALHFMLFFTKIQLSNGFINWVASSCFGIYLLHSNSYLAKPYYDDVILRWFEDSDRAVFIIRSAILIILVAVCAILIDKIRIYIWNRLARDRVWS